MLKTIILLSAAVALCEGWSDTRTRRFPKNFLFGVTAPSARLETDPIASRRDNNVVSSGDQQTDQKHTRYARGKYLISNPLGNYKRDVQLLKNLGVKFYRFTLSWSRLQPDEEHGAKQNSLNEYSELINELLRYKIQPVVILHEYDLPESLIQNGGWTNESIVEKFEDYARVALDNFADRVKLWVTVHDPHEVCYGEGAVCGQDREGVDVYLCVRNVLLAHAKVWRLYDEQYRKKNEGKIGISINADWKEAISNDTGQVRAAEDARQFYIGMYAHPIFSKSGDFPKAVKDAIAKRSTRQGLPASRLPVLSAAQVELVRGSSDYLGLSHFTSELVFRNSSLRGSYRAPSFADDVDVGLSARPEWLQSTSGRQRSVPFGLYKALLWLNQNYDYPEILITGIGWSSTAGLDDEGRVQFLRSYLDALLIGIEDGSRVVGLAVHSLLDDHQWRDGFMSGYGLYEVDASAAEGTRARKSAHVYREIIRSRYVDHQFSPGAVKPEPARLEPKQEL